VNHGKSVACISSNRSFLRDLGGGSVLVAISGKKNKKKKKKKKKGKEKRIPLISPWSSLLIRLGQKTTEICKNLGLESSKAVGLGIKPRS
jgi:hypothetical protein